MKIELGVWEQMKAAIAGLSMPLATHQHIAAVLQQVEQHCAQQEVIEKRARDTAELVKNSPAPDHAVTGGP